MSKKFKKNIKEEHIVPGLKLSMRFVCPNCHSTKVIPRETFNKMTNDTFKNNPIFMCNKCNIRMNPTEVIADF